jgi:hypothetical protein
MIRNADRRAGRLTTLFFLAMTSAFASTGHARGKPPVFAHAIPDAATWQSLAARPQSSATARTEVVKFIFDREHGRLWFMDTNRYPVHYFFVRDHIPGTAHEVRDVSTFNRVQYRDAARRFEMGTVAHYLDSDSWTMELVSGDTLTGDRILTLYETLKGALFNGERLKFRPMSALHEANVAAVRDRLPLATADEVFAGIRYQPLTPGKAFGYLRLVRGKLDSATVRADQVLVLEVLPDEIPVSAAVISRELQAPLGHIAILCATRGTPNIALRDAFERADLRALEGKLVELDVNMQEFVVRETTLAAAEAGLECTAAEETAGAAARRHRDATARRGATAPGRHPLRRRQGRATRRGEPHRRVVHPGRLRDSAVLLPRAPGRIGCSNDLAARLADPAFAQDTAQRFAVAAVGARHHPAACGRCRAGAPGARAHAGHRAAVALDPALEHQCRGPCRFHRRRAVSLDSRQGRCRRCRNRQRHRRSLGQCLAAGRLRGTRLVPRRSWRGGHGHPGAAVRRRRAGQWRRHHGQSVHRAAARVPGQCAATRRQRHRRRRRGSARATHALHLQRRVRDGVAVA